MNQVSQYCMKSVRIRSYSVPHFSAFGLDTEIRSISSYSVQMRENADQNNSEYRHFLRSAIHQAFQQFLYASRIILHKLLHIMFLHLNHKKLLKGFLWMKVLKISKRMQRCLKSWQNSCKMSLNIFIFNIVVDLCESY